MDPVLLLMFLVVFAAGIGVGWWLARRPRTTRSRQSPNVPEPEPTGPPIVLDRAFLEARAQARQKTDETGPSAP